MGDWTAETAEWYAQKYGEYATNRLGIDALELRAHDVVVDVGCGAGAALRHASERVTKGRLIGVDVVPRMVEIARERATGHAAEGRLEFRVGGASRLPVEDGVADVVLAFDSFDHWPDVDAGLAEVRRVLKDGGRFAVVKDGAVPSRYGFVPAAEAAGFAIEREETLAEGEVRCALWVCC